MPKSSQASGDARSAPTLPAAISFPQHIDRGAADKLVGRATCSDGHRADSAGIAGAARIKIAVERCPAMEGPMKK
jgi:hypothetical protein